MSRRILRTSDHGLDFTRVFGSFPSHLDFFDFQESRTPDVVVDDVIKAATTGLLGTFWSQEPIPSATRRSFVGCIVDVGANVGVWSVVAKHLYPNARVVALEPVEDTYDLLRENIARNGPYLDDITSAEADLDAAEAQRCDCGSKGHEPMHHASSCRWRRTRGVEGIIAIKGALDIQDGLRFIGVAPHDSGTSAFQHLGVSELGYEPQKITTMRLSSLRRKLLQVFGIEQIDLLKLDIENAEHAVLWDLGGEDWDAIGALTVEVHCDLTLPYALNLRLLEETSNLIATQMRGRPVEILWPHDYAPTRPPHSYSVEWRHVVDAAVVHANGTPVVLEHGYFGGSRGGAR